MAFNFPNTPSEGTLFTDATSGAQYRYTNGVWMQVSAAQIKLNQVRNRIVNGAMQISQENGRNSVTVTGAFPADQWAYNFQGSTTSAAISVDGNPNFIRISSGATPLASPAASNHGHLAQSIEGLRLADLGWGTANARQLVLRFKARAFANVTLPFTFSVTIRNNAADRTLIKQFTLVTAGVWTEFTATIPGDTTGTWLTDNGRGLVIAFTVMAGTSYTTPTIGSWVAGNLLAGSGNGNLYSVASASIDFADVGLYLDADNTGAAPPWEMPDYADELAACQRYWRFFSTLVVDVNSTSQSGILSPAMRIAPTITGGGPGFTVGYSLSTHCHLYQTARAYQSITANARM